MSKQIKFCEKDEKLINQIIEYQKKNNINSFVEAVRQLCYSALESTVNVKINLK